MKYIIIENEPIALEQLKRIISSLRPDWELTFTTATVKGAVDFFTQGNNVDLCFMDIDLNDGDCFKIFESIEIVTPVIFTTAYSEFTLRAFKEHSLDYLLKPIIKNDVEKAIQKFEKFYVNTKEEGKENHNENYQKLTETLSTKNKSAKAKRVLTVSGDSYGFLNINMVAWFLSEDRYIFAIDFSGHKYMTTLSTLADVIDSFGEINFFRIQRNILCSPESIKGVSKYFKGRLSVKLQAGKEELKVVVSADRRADFLTWLGA